MTSNLDILSFLEADQDNRAKEREEEKELRAKQRIEDREHILTIIQKGILKEVRAAIEPLEERLELQEQVNKQLFDQLNSVKEQMNLLKEVVKDKEDFPVLPQQHGQQVHQVSDNRERLQMRSAQVAADKSIGLGLCASARRVIGFTPIEPKMLEIQMTSYGAKDIEEAKIMEIKSYLKCELKMLPSEIEKLNITRIFPPAKQDWNVLYVEFGNEFEVDTIFSYTKNMTKKDHRVIHWIPKQMYARFRAVESLAYTIRKEEGLKTRVKIGKTDFLLLTRDPSSPVWSRRQLPSSFPEIDQYFISSQTPITPLQSENSCQETSGRTEV